MTSGARSLFSGRPALIALLFYLCGIILAVNLDLPYSIPLALSIVSFFALAITYLKGRFVFAAWLLALALLFLGWHLAELASGDFPPNHISRFALESGQAELRGVVADEPDIRSDRVYFVIETDSVLKDNIWFPTLGRVRASVKGLDFIPGHGDRVSLNGFLYRPEGPHNPGGFDYGAYLMSNGVFAAMSVPIAERAKIISKGDTFLSRIISPLRNRLLSQTRQYFTPTHAAILSGFILGERRDIPEDVQGYFRDTGTLHLMAVSGSNVALVLAVFALPLRLFRMRKSLMAAILLVVTIFFAILTRLEPSVVRASIMAVVGLIAYGWIRKPDYVNLLAFAGLLMLLWRPLEIYDIGMQLSFAATFGIVYTLPRLMQYIPRPSARIGQTLVWILILLLSTIAAQAAVLPLMAHHFRNLPAIGAAANLPVGILASISSSVGIGFYISTIAGGWLSQAIAFPLEILLNLTLSTLRFFASLPYADIQVASPGIIAMAMYWAALYFVFDFITRRRFSARSLIFILIIGNIWLWGGLLRKRPDWTLEFLDSGRNRVWFFTAKGQGTIACYDCNETSPGMDEIIAQHILDHHGGELNFILTGTPDSADVVELAERFSAVVYNLKYPESSGPAIQSTSLLQYDYQPASNFPAGIKIIWGMSDNRGGGEDHLPILQIDVDAGQIILAGRTGAGTLRNFQAQNRVIALELPWSDYARSGCLETIREINPDAVIFSPDQFTAFMPRQRDELTHTSGRIFSTSICGAFTISGDGTAVKYETMRPLTGAGE